MPHRISRYSATTNSNDEDSAIDKSNIIFLGERSNTYQSTVDRRSSTFRRNLPASPSSLVLVLALLSSLSFISAFIPVSRVGSMTPKQQQHQQLHPVVLPGPSHHHHANTAASPVSVVLDMAVDENGVESSTDPTSGGGEPRVVPGTHEELLYALGVNLARQLGDIRPLVQDGEELANVAKGLLDTVVGRLDEDGQRALLASRGKELDEMIVTRANALREKLEARGREMLDNMAQTEGVQKLPSGVLVHVLEDGPAGKGQGVRASKTSVVQLHYHGTLADGTVFDSTLGAEPINFPLANVIPGWRDGVMAMHEGETAMLGIPPEQGYGPEGTPDGRIPGGSALFFKIQLMKVLTAEIGGSGLVGPDGKALKKDDGSGGGLIL